MSRQAGGPAPPKQNPCVRFPRFLLVPWLTTTSMRAPSTQELGRGLIVAYLDTLEPAIRKAVCQQSDYDELGQGQATVRWLTRCWGQFALLCPFCLGVCVRTALAGAALSSLGLSSLGVGAWAADSRGG